MDASLCPGNARSPLFHHSFEHDRTRFWPRISERRYPLCVIRVELASVASPLIARIPDILEASFIRREVPAADKPSRMPLGG
jgi:hypothetical protein